MRPPSFASARRCAVWVPILLLILAACPFHLCTAADPATPGAAILADYRAKAAVVVDKLNETLTSQVATVVADLVKKGDSASTSTVTAQLSDKIAGRSLTTPHLAVATLFKQYDAALARALAPLQQAALGKIEAALKSSAGKDLANVTELGRVQAEIQGHIPAKPAPMVTEWSYHTEKDGPSTSWFSLLPQGVLEWHDNKGVKNGSWRPTTEGFELDFMNEKWAVTVTEDTGVVLRPSVGTRHIKARATTASAPPAAAGLPLEWTYHLTPGTPNISGTLVLAPEGTLKLDFPNNPGNKGTWKAGNAPDTYDIVVNGTEKTTLKVSGTTAVWERPAGVRYLRAKAGSPATAIGTPAIQGRWRYYTSVGRGHSGTMTFEPNGRMVLQILGRRNGQPGSWKSTDSPDVFRVAFDNDSASKDIPFEVKITGMQASMEMPNVGTRYLKKEVEASPPPADAK